MASSGGEQIREIVARGPDALIRWAGARGSPDHDQRFLVNDRVIDRIPVYPPEEAGHSHVLEIGGGPGVLVDRLPGVTDRMTIVEQDRTFVTHLHCELADEAEPDRLTTVEGDTLSVDLPEFTACVSNLPYGISSEIPFRLPPRGKPLVLTFQKEFGGWMAAEASASEYDRLSVSTQHYGEVELCRYVPRKAFNPKSMTQSVVVRVVPCEPEYEVGDEAFFPNFVEALLTQRRKTIRSGTRNTTRISGLSDPEATVEAADEDALQKRASSMAPAELAELVQLAVPVGR